jgi:predicted Zn-dependent protease/transglutaminase-like putative cysteine protease
MKFNEFNKISFLLIFVLFTNVKIFSQSTIQEAYNFLGEGKFEKAEELFLKEAESSNSLRAQLGLAFLYSIESKYDKEWQHFSEVIKQADRPEIYLLAEFDGLAVARNIQNEKSGILELLAKEASNKDDGFISAIANENLGQYYQLHNQLEKAKDYFRHIGAVNDWSVIGPFENISASGYYENYPPENEYNPDTIYTGKNNRPIHWFKIDRNRYDNWVDFTLYFPSDNSIYYGNTFVYSPEEQKVQIRIGTSGSFRAFLNDKLNTECYEERNNDLDTYVTETTLQKGWNRVLIKVGYSDIDRCNFLLRITDDKGFALSNLKYSTDKTTYNAAGNDTSTEVYSSYEKYFTDILKEHPDYPENYVLLSKIYLRNDKISEAEFTLLNGLKILPDNVLLLYSLISVYNKGGKLTERNTICKKIDDIRSDIPDILTIKMMEAAANKNQDKYKELLEKLISIVPESPDLYVSKIIYYSLKNIPSQTIDIINEAYQKYPDEWAIVNFKKNLDYSVSRDYTKAAEIIEKFSENNFNLSAMEELANIYLSTSKIDKWESTYNRIIEQNPASPGFYYQMAKTYYSLQKYDKALNAINEALHICPFATNYYQMLGDIYTAQNDNEDGKEAYRKAIMFSSTNYEAREKLKNLTGDDPIDKELKPFDLKALMATSPISDKYQGNEALILSDDVKRTFYEGGASEYDEEVLIKILNKDGIERFTSYGLNYNSNVQELILDKAVVIKQNGSEIDADKKDGDLVFKSLEVGDYIYVKYKIRNFFTGELSNHFWDEFNFNKFYPVVNERYALITPNNKEVFYRGQNMSSEPVMKKVIGNNTLYVWQMENIQAVKYEAAMPPLDDIGMILYFSTIENWDYIAKWFLNLTNSKGVVNYEIKEKVAELLKGKEDLPEKDKVKIIYEYIIKNITYSSVPFRQSAFIPQKARDVLVTKIGDCKDMATLFITMLKAINVKADYVLVNTRNEDANTNALPGIYFNHVIARVNIDGKPMLFDLTARNYPFGTIPEGDINSFALVVKQDESKPFYIEKKDFGKRTLARNTNVLVKDDNSIELSVDTKRTGSATAFVREMYGNIDEKEQISKLTENLADNFNNYKVLSFKSDDLDTLTTELNYSYSLILNQYIGIVGNYKLLKIPWEDVETSSTPLSYDQRKYAYDRITSTDEIEETMSIKLPAGYTPVELPQDVKLDCKIASYSIEFKYSDGIITAKRVAINKIDSISPEDYKEYKDYVNKTIENDLTQILLKKK